MSSTMSSLLSWLDQELTELQTPILLLDQIGIYSQSRTTENRNLTPVSYLKEFSEIGVSEEVKIWESVVV